MHISAGGWSVPFSGAAGEPLETAGSIQAQNLLARTSAMQESKPEAILDVQGVGYSYDQRALSVLNGCSCVVHNGDRILLQGSSGGGKSTFAAILAGLRPAERGTVFLHAAPRSRPAAAASSIRQACARN